MKAIKEIFVDVIVCFAIAAAFMTMADIVNGIVILASNYTKQLYDPMIGLRPGIYVLMAGTLFAGEYFSKLLELLTK